MDGTPSSENSPESGENASERSISNELGHLSSDVAEKIGRLILDGKKIEAIKAYREKTGMGLKESKEAIEKIMASAGIVSKSAGCASAVLMMVGSSLMAVAAFVGYFYLLKFLK